MNGCERVLVGASTSINNFLRWQSTPPIKKRSQRSKKPEANAPNYSRWMSKPFRDGCLNNNWESFSFHRQQHVTFYFFNMTSRPRSTAMWLCVTAMINNKTSATTEQIEFAAAAHHLAAAAHKELLHQLLIIQ